MDTKHDTQVHSTLSHDSKPQNVAGESHSEPKPKDKKQILVFIPTGLPGMGKSTNFRKLTQILEDKGAQVTVISSDKVRKELMDKAREENPSLSHQDAFNLSSKGANPKFFEYVRNAVYRTKEIPQDLHVIILDKNHPPNIIQQTINTFKDPKYTKDYVIKVAMIKPVCAEDFSTKEATYPFSLTFFLKCVQRALGRGEHETLTGDDTKVASVLCGFFNFHKNFNASNSGYLDMGADAVVELLFTHEGEQIEKELREVVGDSVSKVLRSMKGFEAGEEEMKEFLEKVKALKIVDPSQEELQEKTVKAVEKCLELFANL